MTMFCKERDSHGHGAKYYYMDRDWNMITNGVGDPNAPVEKPACLDKAMELAEILCKPFPFVRVDFFNVGGRVYLSELTFDSGDGHRKFDPSSFDAELGALFHISK